jgi:hypothetical protein
MAFTTLALAVMSTAAPLVLRQHVSATPAHRLSIPEVYNKLVQKKDGAVEFATEFKKQVKSRVFEYRSGLADVRAAITGDYARRRRLSVLDTYFSDLGTIIEAFENGETTGMKDLHSRFMGISCTNGEPNANLMNALESELVDLSEASSLQFRPTITKTFRCLCGSSWDLGGSEHRELHDALKALLDGNDGRSYWTRLIVAGKNTLPSYLGSSGLCSDPCKEMFVTMIELGFSAAEAPDLGAAAILPVAPKAAFPTSYISCMCGMSYDTMLPTLFPDGSEWATVEAMEGLLEEDGLDSRAQDGTHNLLRAATRAAAFLDWWTMDSANLCTADCKTTIELGTTLGIYAGTRQIWPAMVEDTVPAASDADNPDEAEIASLGASITGSMCSSKTTKASSLVLAAEPYIVNGIPDLEDDTVRFVRMVERMLKVMYAPTEYGEGDCSENEFRNMWAKMIQLGTKHAVKLLENTWEGEWVEGYEWRATSGTYEWYQYKEEDLLMVTPGAMTAPELNSMISDAMHCFCDYWTGPGNVFPLIESKVTQYKANEPEDWGEEFAEAGQLAMGATKSCKSMSCRGLFDSLFALVEQLSGVSLTQGIIFNEQPACNAVHADKCWRGECWPMNQEGNHPSQCDMCYKPTEPSSTLYPMAHMDDFADRIMFWSTCSMSTDCPPVGVSSYQVTTTFTLSGIAAADFDDVAQADFKKKFVQMLAPQGSEHEGSISPSDVTLTIKESGNGRRLAGNGIEVQATVDVYSESAKTSFTGALESLSASDATSKLGVTVTGIGEVAVTNVAFSPPSPPPSSGENGGEDDGLSAGELAGIVVGAVGGLCCCGLVCFLAFFLHKKQEAKKTALMTKKSSTTPATSEPAVPVVQGSTLSGAVVNTDKHTLAKDVEIIKRELHLNGTVSEVINEAATQLGINSKGRPLADVSTECVRALGVVG